MIFDLLKFIFVKRFYHEYINYQQKERHQKPMKEHWPVHFSKNGFYYRYITTTKRFTIWGMTLFYFPMIFSANQSLPSEDSEFRSKNELLPIQKHPKREFSWDLFQRMR